MSTNSNGFAAVKAAMMPQIDAALDAWLVQLSATMDAASDAEITRCIGVVESCKMLAKPEWNTAISFAADRLREWQKASKEETPNGGDPR